MLKELNYPELFSKDNAIVLSKLKNGNPELFVIDDSWVSKKDMHTKRKSRRKEFLGISKGTLSKMRFGK